jgi:hypothetical protein
MLFFNKNRSNKNDTIDKVYNNKIIFKSSGKKYKLVKYDSKGLYYYTKVKNNEGVVEKKDTFISNQYIDSVTYNCLSSIVSKIKLFIWGLMMIFATVQLPILQGFIITVLISIMLYIDYTNFYKIRLYLIDDNREMFKLILEFDNLNDSCQLGQIIESHIGTFIKSKFGRSKFVYKSFFKDLKSEIKVK